MSRPSYLFGYGSLVSLQSAERTLRRNLNPSQIDDAVLPDYSRSWTAIIPVIAGSVNEPILASFLDLRKEPGAECNGVVIEVSAEELEAMDHREKGYERERLEVLTSRGAVDAWTYIFRMTGRSDFVLKGYLEIVTTAVASRSEKFQRDFWASTDAAPSRVVSGAYRFTDAKQNEVTGR